MLSIKHLLAAMGILLIAAQSIVDAQVPAVNSGTATYPSTGTIGSGGAGATIVDNTGSDISSGWKTVKGSCTLSTGSCTVNFTNSAVFTSSSSYFCIGNVSAAIATAVSMQNQSSSQVKAFGSGSSVVTFICQGT